MYKVFVYSSDYNVQTYIECLDYILNAKIDAYILAGDEYIYTIDVKKCRIPVEYIQDVDECVLLANMVIILDDGMLPARVLLRIKNKCEYLKITCAILHTRLGNKVEIKEDIIMQKRNVYKQKPTILLLTYGKNTQCFKVEMMLNKMFSKRGVQINQLFDEVTENMLLELKEMKLLSNKFYKDEKINQDVNIVTIRLPDSNTDLFDCMDLIKELCSDFVLLNTNNSFHEFDLINNYLRYCSNAPVDVLVRTHYSQIVNGNKTYTVYEKDIESENEFVLDIDSEKDIELLYTKIIEKLTLPEGIIRIN